MLLEMKEAAFSPPVSNAEPSDSFSWGSKVSPSMLLIIIIVAIIFFISGLLHLLIRFLLRPHPSRVVTDDELGSVTVLQGQLQQLFDLHDSGVDQSFIDTLPVFNYKAIIGLKNPFDCAVCLCEFEAEDKLRLLPKCSHAFHMECIDTWLLSHSTCPLCRSTLHPEFFAQNNPIVLVLESASVENSREINQLGSNSSHLGSHHDIELGLSQHKSCEIATKDEVKCDEEEKVVPVKLGKLRNVDGGEGSSSSSGNRNVDARRCFSMGSYAYVMDDTCALQVPISKKQSCKNPSSGHRQAMSECDFGSRREFKFNRSLETNGASITSGNGKSKRESFSISKIWLRGKKDEKPNVDLSRRAFSFRFPGQQHREGSKAKNGSRRTTSEVDIGSEGNFSCSSLDSQANPPSFATRTLHWLMMARQKNKVVHSSLDPTI